MEYFVIMDSLTGEYLNGDTYEWVDYDGASIYVKMGDKYYSYASGEMKLPENCEWIPLDENMFFSNVFDCK